MGHFSGKHLHLVQFAGPVQAQWREQLLAAGLQIVSYIPENTYLVYGDEHALTGLQTLAARAPHVQWNAAYLNDYKIHPTQARNVDALGKPRDIGTDMFEIQLVDDAAANESTLALLNQLKLAPFLRQDRFLHYLTIIARLDPANLKKISAQPEVVAILPAYYSREKFCERQDQIVAGNLTGNSPTGPGYLAWLTNVVGFSQAQFDASGIVVDVSDSGIDNGTTSPNHFGLYEDGVVTNGNRVMYSRFEETVSRYSTNSLEGCDGHGTINAHIIAGYDNSSGFPFADAQGFHFGLGVCPFVRVGASVIFRFRAKRQFCHTSRITAIFSRRRTATARA